MKVDPIDRQDAIDAMTNVLWHYRHYPNECYRSLNEYEFAKGLAELGLNSVPPVQPEPRWTPCSKGLPKKAGEYYVSGGGKVWICEFVVLNTFPGGVMCVGGWCNDASNPAVQAWMPLPKPYEERQET